MTSDFSEKRVLVTGGRGFIGAAVCGKLRDAGADVWTVARSEPEDDDPQALVGDLQSIDATRQVIAEARPDIILHTTRPTLQGRAGVDSCRDAPAFPGERGRFRRLSDEGSDRLRQMAASICRHQLALSRFQLAPTVSLLT